jgi:hypothetical protein
MRKSMVFILRGSITVAFSRNNFEVLERVFVNYFNVGFLFLNVILITAKTAHIETGHDVIWLSPFPTSSQFIVAVMTSCQKSLSLHF